MKFAVIVCNNGNFSVNSEWTNNEQGAIMDWHDLCRSLWNAPDVISARVKVVDESLNVIGKYDEYINHAQSSQPTETTISPIQQSSQPTETT